MPTRSLPVTIATTGLLALTLAACNPLSEDSSTRDESGEIEEGGEVGALALQRGDCFNEPDMSAAPEEQTEVDQVAAVPCEEPHDFQVYATFDVEDAEAYPGDASLTADGDTGCLAQFEPFVGRDFATSQFNYTFLYPTPETWDIGDREIVCLLVPIGTEQLVGDAEGSGL